MGGYSQFIRDYERDILVLHPHEKFWRKVGELKERRYGFQAVYLSKLLFVLGGHTEKGFEVYKVKPEMFFLERSVKNLCTIYFYITRRNIIRQRVEKKKNG